MRMVSGVVLNAPGKEPFIGCEAYLKPHHHSDGSDLEFTICVINGWNMTEYRGRLEYKENDLVISQQLYDGLRVKHFTHQPAVRFTDLPDALQPAKLHASAVDGKVSLGRDALEWLVSRMEQNAPAGPRLLLRR
jgi:hypothetical protein